MTNKDTKIKVIMPNEELETLKELYKLRSYSGSEECMRILVKQKLDEMNVTYFEQDGNILGLNYPHKPLLNAHLDMVNTGYGYKTEELPSIFEIDDKACIRLYKDKEQTQTTTYTDYWSKWKAQSQLSLPTYETKTQVSLGADDKNGIWVILSLLRAGYEFNFALFHGEEVGCVGSKKAMSDPLIGQFIEKNCSFALTIDRRNSGDIIGWNQKYCVTLDDRLESFSDTHNFGYKCASGLSSDAGPVSQACEAVNLSCGYYEPHTYKEYTNLNELWNTREFVRKILEDFTFDPISLKRLREYKGVKKTSYEETVCEWVALKEQRAKEQKTKTEKEKEPKQQKLLSVPETKTTSITSDKEVEAFIDYRNRVIFNDSPWDRVIKYYAYLNEAQKIEARTTLEEEYLQSDMSLLCLSKHEAKDKRKLFEIQCPECKNKAIISVEDMEDYYGEDWFELEKEYGTANLELMELHGICPECTNELDLTDAFIKAMRKYREKVTPEELENRRWLGTYRTIDM